MKKYVKAIALLLLLLSAVTLLGSCGSTDAGAPESTADTGAPESTADAGSLESTADTGSPESTADTGAPESTADTAPQTTATEDSRVIFADGVCRYSIIRPENGDTKTLVAARAVLSYIKDITGVSPAIKSDWVRSGADPDAVSEYEILIGNTNRTADDTMPDGGSGWHVGVSGNRIVISANRTVYLEGAVEYFKSVCIFSEGIMSIKPESNRFEAISDPYAEVSLTLRVGSYNIKYGANVGLDMSVIAADITALSLDVIGFQEIDQKTSRVNGLDTMKALSRATGYEYYAFARAIDYKGGEYGTGILSRYPIKEFTVIPLESGNEEARSVGHAVLDINGVGFDFFNTHLSYEQKALRTGQFKRLAELAAACETFIITGDFNTAATSEFSVIKNSSLVNANKYGTFPSSGKAIDNIVISGDWSVTNSGMGPSGHSDHNLLWAELKFKRK